VSIISSGREFSDMERVRFFFFIEIMLIIEYREVVMHRSVWRTEPIHIMREIIDITHLQSQIQDNYDIKLFHYRKQQAQIKR
jgi:hypothetical protein